MNNRGIAAFLILLLALALSSCGYRNPYVVREDGPELRLYRPLWINRTTELGLESLLARQLSSWLHKNRKISVSEGPESADYTLKGEIVGVAMPELSFGAFNRANELSLQISVNYTLVENASGQVKWEKKNYLVAEAVAIADSRVDSQSLRKTALTKISNRIAEEIYLYILNTLMRDPLPAGTAPRQAN